MTSQTLQEHGVHGPPVLAHFQAQTLLDARQAGATSARVSLDLGLTTAEVALGEEAVQLSDGQRLTWADTALIVRDAPICFALEDGAARKIHRFSTALNRAYSLMATRGAPTLLNAGFTMHRIVDIDPWEDTRRKIGALGTPRGPVLDTCTGLGYTAIAAARTASAVLTLEIDPLILQIARLNPWSRDLFTTPHITQRIGDTAVLIHQLPSAHFAHILHDPPTLSLAGDLYGGAFYRALYRVLRRGGTLFHYTGNPRGKSGAGLVRGVERRLRDAGFTRVSVRPDAFGIMASKN